MAVSREVIKDVLKTIFKLRNENSPNSYISIKNALKLFSIPVPVFSLPKGKVLYRVRLHTKDESSVLFREIGDFGHRIDRNGIKNFGRANEPFQSIFYCSNLGDVAFSETSNLVRNNKNDKEEVSSLGIWKTTKNINIAYLPKILDYYGNKTGELLNQNINSALLNYNNEDTNNLKFFLNSIADEFTNDISDENFNYLITCAFANYIYETPMTLLNAKEKVYIDGIAYPSVQLKEKGINFSIKPDLIEDKDIILEKVICSKMELVSEKIYIETDTIESKKINYNSDIWEVVW